MNPGIRHCPRCCRPMGDADAALYGKCSRCRRPRRAHFNFSEATR